MNLYQMPLFLIKTLLAKCRHSEYLSSLCDPIASSLTENISPFGLASKALSRPAA